MRDIVFFLPGFAGSHLVRAGDTRRDPVRLWLDVLDLAWRGILHLDADLPEAEINPRVVRPSGIVAEVYQPFFTYCELKGIEVNVWPYDWRGSIEHNANLLKNELASYLRTPYRLTVVGHSMGGLVAAKALQQLDDTTAAKVLRLVTMGTPWKGSYKAVQLMAGTHETVEKIVSLNKILSTRNRYQWVRDSARTIATWPGVYDMLPMPEMMIEYPASVEQDFGVGNFFSKVNPWYKWANYSAAIGRRPIHIGFPPGIQHYNWYGVRRQTAGPMPSVVDGMPEHWFHSLLGDTTVPEFSGRAPLNLNSINQQFDADHEQFTNDPAVLFSLGRLMGVE